MRPLWQPFFLSNNFITVRLTLKSDFAIHQNNLAFNWIVFIWITNRWEKTWYTTTLRMDQNWNPSFLVFRYDALVHANFNSLVYVCVKFQSQLSGLFTFSRFFSCLIKSTKRNISSYFRQPLYLGNRKFGN